MFYITDIGIFETYKNDSESTIDYLSAFDVFKRRRINLIENSFEKKSNERFLSNGRYFDANETDRTALIGSITAGVDTYYKSYSDLTENEGFWNIYTTNQLKQILNDGRVKLIQLIQKRDTLITGIKASLTEGEVLTYVW